MSGLYIHIPFCKSRCIYCGFFSTTDESLTQRYVDALCRELELRHDGIVEPWRTVYFGGGTPSQLSASQLEQLFHVIDTSEAVEVTVECNPDDVTPEWAATLASLPVNRVSMGAQTFSDARLKFLHRRHTAHEVEEAVERLRKAGIGNISIDLMYGFPGESMADWQSDIDRALALDVEHLSAYCLSIEEHTPLHRLMERGEVSEADEELCRSMYYTLKDRLQDAGYEHYEISNFARPGRRSVHNSSYWQSVPYMGLGAAAHSFDGRGRQWNVAHLRQYIASIERGELPAEREELSQSDRYDEMVMLRLRTCEGIDLAELERTFGSRYLDYCLSVARPHLLGGLLERTPDARLRLTRHGLFVSDSVMSDLMSDE